jgi:hypothetical protein
MPIRFVPPPLPPPPPRPSVTAFVFSLLKTGLPELRLDPGLGIVVQPGVEGLDDPTLTFLERSGAGLDGAEVEQILADPRDVVLPLYLKTGSLGELRALKDRIRQYTNPKTGPFTVRAGLSDGTGRLIDGYYRAGMDTTMSADTYWSDSQKLSVICHAGQPFWRAEQDISVEWATPTGRRPLLPILPLGPGAGALIGNTNPVTVAGQVPTYPVWYITGPIESIVFLDVGTGRTFTFTASVAGGDTWTIDTRPGRKGVFDQDGARQRSTLNPGADLFPLQPGVSAIQTTATGTDTGTKIVGSAPQLYLAA